MTKASSQTAAKLVDRNILIRSDTVIGISVGPFYRFGCFVVLADVVHEFSFEIGHRSKNAAGNDITLDFGKPQFDLVEPGGISGRVMERNFGVIREELFNPSSLVC